ncbi:MAG: MFS transporter [Acidimicrobiales bacterium]|nr:MFS transporter [Acidimicrobiales bacterium]
MKHRPFLALLVASGGFVIVLDSFAAAVAFPRLVAEFSSTPRSTLAWVSSGYSIALAALLLVAGAFADRYGGRRVYLSGMAAFMLGAACSAAAPNPGLLITARVFQGCAGAMMISTSIALALAEYPAERRGVAMGWMGVMGSIASIAGPVLAGTIIDVGGSWRWVFLVSVPVGLVVLAAGPRVLQAGPDPAASAPPIDGLGVLVVVAASGLLTFAILRTAEWGWLDGRTLATLAVAVGLGALFVWRCRRVAFPLLRLELFAEHGYRVASISQLGSQFSIFAFFFWTPLFLENVWGWRASTVGWVVAVPLVISFISMPIGRFTDRRGSRHVLVAGGLSGAAAHAWWWWAAGSEPSFWVGLLPGLLLFGAGIGMVGITAASAALARVQRSELALANSAFQTGRRLTQTLGVATVIAVLGDRSTDSVERFQVVWLVAGIGFVLSSVVAARYPRLGPAEPEVPAAAAERVR